jgi:protocatechuate 3,4-dioxygenase alpha subunit
MSGQTPWQTTGPFFHFGVLWKGAADLAGDSDLGARPDLTAPGHDQTISHGSSGRERVAGERIELTGRVFDNTGAPIMDALIETWQANAAGRYAHPEDNRADVALDPHFVGFGRTALDKNGAFRLRTIRPGRVPGPGNSLQAPHIALGLMGPGFLKRLSTRVYFSDARDNDEDPILALVPEARRSTLIATKEPGTSATYRFDIYLGGGRETVFFDI